MTAAPERAADVALALARRTLAGRPAWLVGGLVRDRARGHARAGEPGAPGGGVEGPADVDIVVRDDPREVARALSRAGAAASFALSEDVGSWRVVSRDRSWQIDVEPLRGESIEADLALRDFTINAVAQTLDSSLTLDPLGGLRDLAERRLRMVSERAFAEDPLRVLRLVRQAVDFRLRPEERTLASARASASKLREVSAERVFAELKLIVCGRDPLHGLCLMGQLGATAAVLPELEALRGVKQTRFHHRDVYGHTLEVLDRTIVIAGLARPPGDGTADGDGDADGDADADGDGDGDGDARVAAILPAMRLGAARDALAEPLADGLTRADALRFGALFHDAAKPLTEGHAPGGRVTFVGHDVRGAELARAVLARLRASERLTAHVSALVRHHLRLGFLVHESQPLARRTVYRYLRACGPVALDVTMLSIADRLATRGEHAEEAIAAHLAVAGPMLEDALRWRHDGPPGPLWRGDELAGALGIAPGPVLGELLEELREARFAGEVSDREQALAHARAALAHAHAHAAPTGARGKQPGDGARA